MFPYKIISDKKLKKVKIIKTDIFKDLRGNLFTVINNEIEKKIIKKKYKNYIDKVSIRKKNSLTGIHIDNKSWKIITCLEGCIKLVVVDCIKKSKKYLTYTQILLNKCNKSVIIPPKFGVSYLCLKKKSFIHYKFLFNGNYNDIKNQRTLSWKDKKINIKWPIKKPILSKRDKF